MASVPISVAYVKRLHLNTSHEKTQVSRFHEATGRGNIQLATQRGCSCPDNLSNAQTTQQSSPQTSSCSISK